jgi:hypothetical protein
LIWNLIFHINQTSTTKNLQKELVMPDLCRYNYCFMIMLYYCIPLLDIIIKLMHIWA